VALQLKKIGVGKVRPLEGGLDAWKKRNDTRAAMTPVAAG
jgi:rhodanese-related sulfurtransferase